MSNIDHYQIKNSITVLNTHFSRDNDGQILIFWGLGWINLFDFSRANVVSRFSKPIVQCKQIVPIKLVRVFLLIGSIQLAFIRRNIVILMNVLIHVCILPNHYAITHILYLIISPSICLRISFIQPPLFDIWSLIISFISFDNQSIFFEAE